VKNCMHCVTAINASLFWSSLEPAENVTGDETVVAIEVTACRHETFGTCSHRKNG
jgi:hypothetical protein